MPAPDFPAPRPAPSRRETLQKFFVIRNHSRDARLLQHDLRNPDGVWIARAPPRQIPPIPFIPLHQRALDRFDGQLIMEA